MPLNSLSMNKTDLTAVIVLSFNKRYDILECLGSIFNLEYDNYEIIVVDNGSTDGSPEAVKSRYPQVHLLESKKNLGVAGGRNLGIKYVSENLNCNYILFLDDDVIIDKKALGEMISSFYSNKNIGIVAPKCFLSAMPGIIGYAGGLSVNLFTGKIADIGGGKKDNGQFDKSAFISSSGGLCLVSRSLFNEIGLYDENFNPYGWEDVDFSLRAVRKGYRIYYNHKAVVFHKGGKIGRGKGLTDYEFSKSRNYFYLIRKHANFFQRLTIGSILPFRILSIVLKQLARKEFKTLTSQLGGFLSLLNKRPET